MNSLFHEIAYSSQADRLLGDLLSEAVFPFTDNRPPRAGADVLMELSFSDFGDADALLLYSSEGCAVFVEAKVKAGRTRELNICEEYRSFAKRSAPGRVVSSSNLFAQLYAKYRLVEGLRDGSIRAGNGIEFPSWSRKQVRKIGKNPVVGQAVHRLSDCIHQVFYLALVPGECKPGHNQGETGYPCLARQEQSAFQVGEWNLPTFGWLTWTRVAEFCRTNELQRTCRTFKFNAEQIYAL